MSNQQRNYFFYFSRGFSLLEVFISLVIITILILFSSRYYTVTIAYAKLTEATVLLSEQKSALALYYSQFGTFPPSATELNLAKTEGQYVKNISLDYGTLTAHFKQDATFSGADYRLSLQAVLLDQNSPKTLLWQCGYTSSTINNNAQAIGENITHLPPSLQSYACSTLRH